MVATRRPEPNIDDVDFSVVLSALANPSRRAIVVRLAQDPPGSRRGASQLRVRLRYAGRGYCLNVLREAGLISQEDERRQTFVWLRRSELDRRFPRLVTVLLEADDPTLGVEPPRQAAAIGEVRAEKRSHSITAAQAPVRLTGRPLE